MEKLERTFLRMFAERLNIFAAEPTDHYAMDSFFSMRNQLTEEETALWEKFFIIKMSMMFTKEEFCKDFADKIHPSMCEKIMKIYNI